ncbi:MAG: nicotinate-nucleotide adenylyltransferase [Thermoleophilia bacterium]|nr:nicotinate-nucleotide adenylyltransferase [Thermoleophilia bacterium]
MDPIERMRMRPGLRLGIMGGTFDPIHIGHLVTAEEARQQFSLDEILFMPTGTPPHKTRQVASAELRHLMVSIATATHPHFWVSRYEMDAPGVDYTVDTLSHVSRTLSVGTQVFFITGADAVLDILTWKQPERVLELAAVIAATRPGYDLGRLSGVLAGLDRRERVHVMEIPALAVSSSMIRARLAQGRGCRYLVPEGVGELIEKSGVYADPKVGVSPDQGHVGLAGG